MDTGTPPRAMLPTDSDSLLAAHSCLPPIRAPKAVARMPADAARALRPVTPPEPPKPVRPAPAEERSLRIAEVVADGPSFTAAPADGLPQRGADELLSLSDATLFPPGREPGAEPRARPWTRGLRG